MPASTIAAAGASVLTGGARAITGMLSADMRRDAIRSANKRTIRFKKQAAAKQRAFAQNMLQQKRAYQTPAAQMKRLKAAGLNPNLAYGMGTAGNVGYTPSYQQPNLSVQPAAMNYRSIGEGIQEGLTTFQSLRQNAAQVDKLKESANATAQQAILTRQMAIIQSYNVEGARLDSYVAKAMKKYSTVGGKNGQVRTGLGTMDVEEARALWKGYLAEESLPIVKKYYQKLLNDYQTQRNKFAEKGMSINDNIQWRALIGLIKTVGDFLGVDTSWIDFSPNN